MKDKLLLASKSLVGISIADAFGESFFGEESLMKNYIHQRIIPESSLDFTDDTIMAIAVFKSLEKFGEINQDFLARVYEKLLLGHQQRLRAFNTSILQRNKKWRKLERGFLFKI